METPGTSSGTSSGIHRRCPALVAAVFVAMGIAVSDRLCLPIGVWLVAASAAWFVALVGWLSGGRRTMPCALWFVLCALGGVRHHQYTQLLSQHHVSRAGVYGTKGELVGRLAHDPDQLTDGRQRVVIHLDAIAAEGSTLQPLTGDLLLTTSADVHGFVADAGDRVRWLGRIRQPQPARNPGEFDYRRFLDLRHNLHATGTIYREGDVISIDSRPDHWWR